MESFFEVLVPKAEVEFVFQEDTVRQVLERMAIKRYGTVPVIEKDTGKYIRSLSEGDVLFYLRDHKLDFKELESCSCKDIPSSRNIEAISIYEDIQKLRDMILNSNYVPVVDDRGVFMGLITRRKFLLAIGEMK
ncbi:MAG: CBS domain-containing protein [Bacilli bacterium]|nr:CBS domain-containing protein [Bacilli bacterium]